MRRRLRPGHRPRPRGLTAVAALLALAGVAGLGAAPASAAPAAGRGTYIVQLTAEPLATYAGDVKGLPATSPAETGAPQLNVRSTDAKRYRGFLADQEAQVLDDLGGPAPTVEYRYRTALAGFAARLTPDQVAELRASPDVAHVWPNGRSTVQAAPDPADGSAVEAWLGGAHGDGAAYLGLPTGLWSRFGGADHAGEGVIVGVIDTGITPQHPSFADDPSGGAYVGSAYPATPPVGWHGTCEAGEDGSWTASDCNDKLIGARYYVAGFGEDKLAPGSFVSARDDAGHGSHTAATAAGNFGVAPSIMGSDLGVDAVSGIAPRAYVAAYKICWSGTAAVGDGCTDADAVAAINDAVADGVDVINFSVGGDDNSVVGAMGAAFLGATQAGVFVATSAGNAGPDDSTIGDPAGVPWVTTVGAATLARTFEATATIQPGAGAPFDVTGASVTGALPAAPLVKGSAAKLTAASAADAGLCKPGTLDPTKVAGKVVFCLRGDNARTDKSHQVQLAGGAGMILANAAPDQDVVTDNHWVPTAHVSYEDGLLVLAAIDAGGAPTATLGAATSASLTHGGTLAAFSSRGPQSAVPDIPKPDVTAPGVNILAANTPSPVADGPPGELFQSISGTSMASPHVAGAGALLKQAHPTWAPDAIKSALMTTANPDVLAEDDATPATPLQAGSGEIDPNRAVDPGLVVTPPSTDDYLGYLEGQDPAYVQGDVPTIAPTNLNLPSIAASRWAGSVTVRRTVTSVDETSTRWTASVRGLDGIDAQVVLAHPDAPDGDTFTLKPGRRETIRLTLTQTTAPPAAYTFGTLRLTDGARTVDLPISARPLAVAAPADVATTTDQPTGDLPLPVRAGFAGTLGVAAWGLAPPVVDPSHAIPQSSSQDGPVLDGTDAGTKISPLTVPAGTQLVSARLSDVDGGSPDTDLDLFLYRDANHNGRPDAGEQMADSATTRSDEAITLQHPEGGDWFVVVHGYAAATPASTYTLTTWVAHGATPNATSDAPSLTLDGGPFAVTPDLTRTPTLHWSNVTRKGLYLGLATFHDGAPATADNQQAATVVELTQTADVPEPPTPTTPTTPQEPQTPTTPTVPTTPTTPKPAPPVALTIRASKVTIARDRRTLRATVRLPRAAKVGVTVRRGRTTVARAASRTVKAGTRTVTLRLNRTLARGRSHVATFSASAGGRVVHAKVTLKRIPR